MNVIFVSIMFEYLTTNLGMYEDSLAKFQRWGGDMQRKRFVHEDNGLERRDRYEYRGRRSPSSYHDVYA